MPALSDQTSNTPETSAELRQVVVDYYESRLAACGPTPEGMDWKDAASQRLRFAVLCDICDLSGLGVHEIGAGAGHLYDFLQDHGIKADYTGSDRSEAMVRAARGRLPQVDFTRRDILTEPDLPTYDVVLCSGVFHVKLDQPETAWRAFVYAMVLQMFTMCRVGIAFNLMTDQVNFRADRLWYSNPGETLDFCRRALSRHVVIRHDYPLYEYTTFVYRHPTR